MGVIFIRDLYDQLGESNLHLLFIMKINLIIDFSFSFAVSWIFQRSVYFRKSMYKFWKHSRTKTSSLTQRNTSYVFSGIKLELPVVLFELYVISIFFSLENIWVGLIPSIPNFFQISKWLLYYLFFKRISSITIYRWSYSIKLKVWRTRPLLGVFSCISFVATRCYTYDKTIISYF